MEPTTIEKSAGYRPDIDGLRAIAVLLVILDHLHIQLFPGGFIGVDIFFVISGYLITGHVAARTSQGSFSILGFYERRVRRILPALLVVLAFTSVLAWYVCLPADLSGYSQSLIAALLSYANIFFYASGTGYFGANSTQLLLHTWSLGVEEQFYLVLPVYMLLLSKRPVLRRQLLIVVAVLSLMLSTWYAVRSRDLAYYMPQTRAWELLCGSLLSLGLFRAPRARASREVLALLSLAVILGFAVFYQTVVPFPGVTALPACAASVALILLGEHEMTFVGRLLSTKPLTFIGLISYSLYLWHLPIVLAARLGLIPYVHGEGPSGYVFVFATSMLAATLSWWFVERPFRFGRWKRLSQRRIFALAGAGAMVYLAVAIGLKAEQGHPDRYTAEELHIGSYDYKDIVGGLRDNLCFVEGDFSVYNAARCTQMESGKKNVLLVGDSHAAALYWGLSHAMPEVNLMQATSAACFEAIDPRHGHSECTLMRRYVYEQFLPTHHVDAVILAGPWQTEDELKSMMPTVDWYAAHQIPLYLIGPMTQYTAPLPQLLALSDRLHEPDLPNRALELRLRQLDRRYQRELAHRPYIHYISLWDTLCSDDRCPAYVSPADRVPMVVDQTHFSMPASLLVAQKLRSEGVLPH